MLLQNSIFTEFGGLPVSPAFVSTSYNSATGTSVVVNAPTGIQAGDLLVAMYEGNTTGTPTITVPSGFSNLIYAYNAGDDQVSIRTKVATGSEPSTYTFSNSGASASIGASISVWRGVTDIDVIGTALANSSTASLTAPSATPTKFGTLVYAAARTRDAGTISSGPAGMTQRLGNTTAPAAYLYDQRDTPPGATGTKTLTLGNSRPSWAILFQLY